MNLINIWISIIMNELLNYKLNKYMLYLNVCLILFHYDYNQLISNIEWIIQFKFEFGLNVIGWIHKSIARQYHQT